MGPRRRLKSACPCLVSLLTDLERIVVLGHGTLQLYILRYHLIRHVARCHHEALCANIAETLRPLKLV